MGKLEDDDYEYLVFLEAKKKSIWLNYNHGKRLSEGTNIYLLGKPFNIIKVIDHDTIEVDPKTVPACAKAVAQERPPTSRVPTQPRSSFFRRFWGWLF